MSLLLGLRDEWWKRWGEIDHHAFSSTLRAEREFCCSHARRVVRGFFKIGMAFSLPSPHHKQMIMLHWLRENRPILFRRKKDQPKEKIGPFRTAKSHRSSRIRSQLERNLNYYPLYSLACDSTSFFLPPIRRRLLPRLGLHLQILPLHPQRTDDGDTPRRQREYIRPP